MNFFFDKNFNKNVVIRNVEKINKQNDITKVFMLYDAQIVYNDEKNHFSNDDVKFLSFDEIFVIQNNVNVDIHDYVFFDRFLLK